MANVKRHGSKYQARVRKLDPSGLVVDKSKSFSLKKDAEKWAREMERSIENGTHKNTSERHWSLFIDPYLEYYEQSSDKVRPRDVKVRRTHLKEFWLPLIGDKYISSIDEQDLRDGQAEADNGERENSTVNKYVFSMQNFLQWADENNLLSRSAPKIRQLTQGDGRIRWLSKDVELPAFKKTLASCSDDDLRAFISIAFFTGCRAGEILALQWKKFDFQRQTVRFEKTKADNARTVSLSGCWDTVEPLIERWDNDPAAFVFTNADGTPPYNYHPRFDRFRKAAGL